MTKCKIFCCIFLVCWKGCWKHNSNYYNSWCLGGRGATLPIKVGSTPSLWLALPHMMTRKPLLPVNLFAFSILINITMARYHNVSFYPQLLRKTSSTGLSPGQTNSPRLHRPTNEQLLSLPRNKFAQKSSPMKRFFWKSYLHTLWGKRNNETSQFLLNFLTACDNE